MCPSECRYTQKVWHLAQTPSEHRLRSNASGNLPEILPWFPPKALIFAGSNLADTTTYATPWGFATPKASEWLNWFNNVQYTSQENVKEKRHSENVVPHFIHWLIIMFPLKMDVWEYTYIYICMNISHLQIQHFFLWQRVQVVKSSGPWKGKCIVAGPA